MVEVGSGVETPSFCACLMIAPRPHFYTFKCAFKRTVYVGGAKLFQPRAIKPF